MADPVTGTALTALRYLAGVAAVAVAYYAAGKASLALQYTGPVAAVWLSAGVGAAALYLGGLRLWPGVLIADLALADPEQPIGTALGITAGNILDIVVMVVLLRLLLGRRGRLDRLERVGGILLAIAAGAAITATFATIAMNAGGIVDSSGLPAFWRSWFLADACGSLIIIPLALAWAQPLPQPLRRRDVWQATLTIGAVVALSAIAVSGEVALTYLVFPALMWAALRFGERGATLAVAVAAGITVWLTAHETGAFVARPITDAALSTQLYLAVAALSTLCLAAVVAERQRALLDLAESERGERQRATEERQRIARDLHDSVSQSLFSSALHLRTADRALAREGHDPAGAVRRELGQVTELTSGALAEMRALVFELRPDALATDGLLVALARHGAALSSREELTIEVRGPEGRLPLSPHAEEHLYRLGQEALANVVRHAQATTAEIDVTTRGDMVAMEIRDDGRGFDPAAEHGGGFGLRSMRARAAQLGGRLRVTSATSRGTVVRAEVPIRWLRDGR